jgi:hypothetical protein
MVKIERRMLKLINFMACAAAAAKYMMQRFLIIFGNKIN